MKARFSPKARLILVRAYISGPLGRVNLTLAVDTGATRTTIDPDRLDSVGLEIIDGLPSRRVTTASGFEQAPLVTVPRLEALGRTSDALTVLAYKLPANAGFDGLLGLDFMRGLRLTIDFRIGSIEVD